MSIVTTHVSANIKSNPKMSAADVTKDVGILTHLMPESFSGSVGLQEIQPPYYVAIVKQVLALAGYWAGNSANSIPILWTNDLKLIASGRVLVHVGIPGVTPSRWIVWVVLEDAAGRRFWHANTHFISSAWSGRFPKTTALRQDRWRKHDEKLAEVVTKLLHTWGPNGVVTGDFNRGGKYMNPALVAMGARFHWADHGSYGSSFYDYLITFGASVATPVYRTPLQSDHDAVSVHLTFGKEPVEPDPVPTPVPNPTPTPTEETVLYPKADAKTQWFQGKYGGSKMRPNVVVLHTTEGGNWPGYEGGATAPNLTVKADKANKKLLVRQHFSLDISSRALRNTAGGVETNTLNCIQIELVGTCDPKHKDGYGAIYWPDAPEWALKELGLLLARLHQEYPAIALKAAGTIVDGRWPAYPNSINANRMSGDAWSRFYGVCGHQHVPENVHGDPGALPIAKVMAYANGDDGAPAPTKPKGGNARIATLALRVLRKTCSPKNRPFVDHAIDDINHVTGGKK